MNISMKQKWTHRLREQISGAKGQGVREGKIESLGLADANYHREQINKVLCIAQCVMC